MKQRIQNIHFVGIGGSGMSGIAEVMKNLGYTVTGSDLAEGSAVKHLRDIGIQIWIGHDANHVVAAHAEAVVTSTAVKADNPEVLEARQRKIPIVPRAVMLAELMRLRKGIAVAGTHGKTTTTSLLSSVLGEAGMDPTFVIGGRLNAVGANARLGQGDYIVAEADESDASFLSLSPVAAIVTNIDIDHMATYEHDLGKLHQAFIDFLHRTPFYGTAFVCLDDVGVQAIINRISRAVVTYGMHEEANYRATNVRSVVGGQMEFTVTREPRYLGQPVADLDVTLNLAGVHNVLNALATIAVATEMGVSDQAILKALKEFRGVDRRFQRYGEVSLPQGGKIQVIDDYGHHPAEMSATIAAMRGAFPENRLVVVFQPHRYTRTRDCFEDFVKVLSNVDRLLITEVYPAGEEPIVAADGRALSRAIRVVGMVEPVFVESVTELPDVVLNSCQDGDVVLTIGAGSIGRLPQMIKDYAASSEAKDKSVERSTKESAE